MSAVSLVVEDFVATLTVDCVDALVDRAFVESLVDAASDLAGRTHDVRAVLVSSARDDLALDWAADVATPEAASVAGAGFAALAAVPQPVVVAIEGRAYSAGLELALAGDVRVAGERATFAMPDVAAGRVPRGGGTQRLPRAVGRAHALRLLLLGETIDAAEARRIGLVSRVVSSGEAHAAGLEIARAIAARGPIATRFAKEAVTHGLEMSLDQALRYELDLTVILQTTADRAEGVQAFAEHRPPEFTGR
jgi:enoyl-CoA hydratase/carnithine racemase